VRELNISYAEIAAVIVFFIGFFGLISNKNILRSIICLGLMEMSVVIFYLSFSYEAGKRPPIGTDLTNVADPFPQSLVFTAIILGVAATAISLTMLIAVYRQSHSTDWDVVDPDSRTHVK